ncbi:hypothetical protein ACFLWX_02345 [Chloroflexota bacterium]
MKRLSTRKELGAIQDYLSGFSYDEIVKRRKISKGAVTNIVAAFKEGQILEINDVQDVLEILREISIDLKKSGLSVTSASLGLALFFHLQGIEVEPADIGPWVAMCRELASQQQVETQTFVRAAMALHIQEERTGLSPEALEQRAVKLQDLVNRLEPTARELEKLQPEIEDLRKRRDSLQGEVSVFEQQKRNLGQELSRREKREAELNKRIQQLEERSHEADERLAAARQALKVIAELGLSPNDLPVYVARIGGIAQRHGISPEELSGRLLCELESLEAGLGLDSLLKDNKKELREVEQTTAGRKQELAALESALRKLKEEEANLQEAIRKEKSHVFKAMRESTAVATEAVNNFRATLGKGVSQALAEVDQLKVCALELGRQVGRLEEVVQTNQWLEALLSLAKGTGEVSSAQVRMVALMVLKGISQWLDWNPKYVYSIPVLSTMTRNAIVELERWKA